MKRSLASVLNAPIIGHGIGTSREVSANIIGGRAQPTHNLFIETLQEVGVIGFILFMLYIKSIIAALIAAKTQLDEEGSTGFLTGLIYALLVWVFMDLVYSLSCFGLSSWEWYLFGGVAAVACRLVSAKKQAEEREANSGIELSPGRKNVTA
jgi:O-antigen ligase